MRTEEFFELVNSGELTELDIHNHVQKLTDNYEETKIDLLSRDFDTYLFRNYIMVWDRSFTLEQIKKKIDELDEAGINISKSNISGSPFYISDHFNYDRHTKRISREKETLLLKIWSLSYVYSTHNKSHYIVKSLGDFVKILSLNFTILQLRNLLIDLKRKHTDADYRFDDKKPQVSNIQPIHWLKGEESLRQFIKALRSADLIENRDTDEILQEHFYIDAQEPTKKEPIKEPQPIIWKSKKVLLAHLIAGLDSSVKADHLWKTLAPHFRWNGKIPTGLRQAYNNNSFPNNIDVIQGILKKIKESK